MASPILNGSVAQVLIKDKVVGIYTSCTWNFSYDVHTAHVLGRYQPAAFTPTGQNAVSLSLTGFRVVDRGVFQLGTVPELKNIMSFDGITVKIFDRASKKDIMTVVNAFPTGFSTGVNARSVSDVSVQMIGQALKDEFTDGTEASGATNITD